MAPSRPRTDANANGSFASDYILQMIAELAGLARDSGETVIAIHLEAILEARRAAREDRLD